MNCPLCFHTDHLNSRCTDGLCSCVTASLQTPSPSRELATNILNALDAWDDERTKGMPPKSKSQIIESLIDEALARASDEGLMGCVRDYHHNLVRESYSAGKVEGLEQAAKIIEDHYWDSLEYDGIGKKHSVSIVAKIRALQGE